jgi:alpha-tubulin suppressor-like RCC1 family protein
MCKGQCADTLNDPKHCGSCSVACEPGVECHEGICGRSLYRGTGSESPCATKKPNGDLYCWGKNASYQLGTGDNTDYSSPQPITSFGENVRYAASTGYANCVLYANGGISCVGANTYGELGISPAGGTVGCGDKGLKLCDDTPQTTFTSGFVELVGVGDWNGGSHFCARTGAGNVWCWGDLRACSSDALAHPVPKQIGGLTDVVQIVAGQAFNCALHSNGTVSCWGSNCNGTLGQGDLFDHAGIVQVKGLSGVTTIGAGLLHVCARAADGLYCWGNNRSGQLGIDWDFADAGAEADAGDQNYYKVPKPTKVAAMPGLDDVVQIVGGVDAGCFLTATGDVYCAGASGYGLMGTGNKDGGPCPQGGSPCQIKPVQAQINGVAELALGDYGALARLSAGGIVSWGSNNVGQAGIGAPGTAFATPTPVVDSP